MDQQIPLSDLKRVLERESGIVFEKVAMVELLERAQAEGLSAMLAVYLRKVSDVPISFLRLVKQISLFEYPVTLDYFISLSIQQYRNA